MSMNALPPQAIEAEQALLASALAEPDTLLVASDILGAEDFYREPHKLIFSALLDLHQLGDTIDLVTLCERLQNIGALDKAGGSDYISELAAGHVTSANTKFHANIIKKKSLLRQTGTWAASVMEQSRNGIENVGEWLGKIESELVDLSLASRSKHSPLAGDIISSLRQYWNNSLTGQVKNIPAPAFLEAQIPGFYPKHLWMVGGYTGKGKSIFLNQILCDAMSAGAKILLFSLEDSREEKMMRMIAALANIPYKALMTGKISNFKDDIRSAEKALTKWNPIIYDDIRTVDDIRLKSKKHKIKDGINIVAIDYVQNLAIKNTLYETMVDAAVKLDAMVKELEITCIGVSQIDNESAKKDSGLIGLKGAGELAAAAAIVLWLTRGGKGKERHIDCTIKKNRPFGETGKKELIFNELWNGVRRRYNANDEDDE